MAINLKTFPSGTAPYTGTAWQNMINNLLGAQLLSPGRQVLTDWTSTATGAQIAQGTYFMHAGSMYLTETSNETITGTIAAGINYIKFSVSGTTLTAAWTNSLTGFSYNPAYQGWYDSGGDQLFFNGIYLDGTNYRRAVASNNLTPYQWIIADGRFYMSDRDILLNGSDIVTGNGAILTGSGLINGVAINSSTGTDTNGGDISTSGGDIDTEDGDVLIGEGLVEGSGIGSVLMKADDPDFENWGLVGVVDSETISGANASLLGRNVIGFLRGSPLSVKWGMTFNPTTLEIDYRSYGGSIYTEGGDVDIGGGKLIGNLHGLVAVPDVFAQVGNSLAITTVGVPSITALSSSAIAYIDTTNDELRTYSFDGTDWSQIGNGLSITGLGAASMAGLTSSTIAYYDAGNKDLRTYSFDGTDWSQVGNDLNLSTSSNGSLTALSTNTIALIDDGTDTLRKYSFDGTDWSLVGSALSITGSMGQVPRIAALKENLVAVYLDSFSVNYLRTYYFNGTNWSQIGTQTTLSTSLVNITAMTQNRIALIDWNSDELLIYDFDGDTLTPYRDTLSISGVSQASITALSTTKIAFIDIALDSLRTYEFDLLDPYPPSPAF